MMCKLTDILMCELMDVPMCKLMDVLMCELNMLTSELMDVKRRSKVVYVNTLQ